MKVLCFIKVKIDSLITMLSFKNWKKGRKHFKKIIAAMEGEGKKWSKHLHKSNPIFHNGEWERKGTHTHTIGKITRKRQQSPPFTEALLMLKYMHRIFSHLLQCNMANRDCSEHYSQLHSGDTAAKDAALAERKQTASGELEQERKRNTGQKDWHQRGGIKTTLLTHAGLSGSQWNWWQSLSLQNNQGPMWVRIPHF